MPPRTQRQEAIQRPSPHFFDDEPALKDLLRAAPWCWPREVAARRATAERFGFDYDTPKPGQVLLVAVQEDNHRLHDGREMSQAVGASLWGLVIGDDSGFPFRDDARATWKSTAPTALKWLMPVLAEAADRVATERFSAVALDSATVHQLGGLARTDEVRQVARLVVARVADLKGPSFGLSFLLAQLSWLIGVPVPVDVAASAAIDSHGNLVPVDAPTLIHKVRMVSAGAPSVERFFVAAAQQEEARQAAEGHLTVIGETNADAVFRQVFISLNSAILTAAEHDRRFVRELLAGVARLSAITTPPFHLRDVPLMAPVRTLDEVTCWTRSPDGRSILAAVTDGSIREWDTEAATERWTMVPPEAPIGPPRPGRSATACAYSVDGKSLVVGFADGTLRLWDGETHTERSTIAGGERITRCSFVGPDDSVLFSSAYGAIGLLNKRISREPLWLRQPCPETPPRGALAREWPERMVDEARVAERFLAPSKFSDVPLRPSCVAPDESRIVVLDRDGQLRLWDAATGRPLWSTSTPQWDVRCAFSPDGKYITVLRSAVLKQELVVVDASTGSVRQVFAIPEFSDCVFLPDGERLLVLTSHAGATFWDIASGTVTETLRPRESLRRCLASDGRRVYVCESQEGELLRLWDATTKEDVVVVRELPSRLVGAGDDSVLSGLQRSWTVDACSVSPDGALLLALCWGCVLVAWDIRSGGNMGGALSTPVPEMIRENTHSPETFEFLANRTRFVTDHYYHTERPVPRLRGRKLKLWDIATPRAAERSLQ